MPTRSKRMDKVITEITFLKPLCKEKEETSLARLQTLDSDLGSWGSPAEWIHFYDSRSWDLEEKLRPADGRIKWQFLVLYKWPLHPQNPSAASRILANTFFNVLNSINQKDSGQDTKAPLKAEGLLWKPREKETSENLWGTKWHSAIVKTIKYLGYKEPAHYHSHLPVED